MAASLVEGVGRPAGLAAGLAIGALFVAFAAVIAMMGEHGLRCEFIDAFPSRPLASLPAGAHPGLLRLEFEGAKFKVLRAMGTDSSIDLSWDGVSHIENRSFRWWGWLEVPVAGTYGLGTTSDDGSVLMLDDWMVVPNDGPHEKQTRWSRVHLDKGFHRLRLDYFQLVGSAMIRLLWQPPGEEPAVIAPRYLHWISPADRPDRVAAGVSGPERLDSLEPLSEGRVGDWSWIDTLTQDPHVPGPLGPPPGGLASTLAMAPRVVRSYGQRLQVRSTATLSLGGRFDAPSVVWVDGTAVLGRPDAPMHKSAAARIRLAPGAHSLVVTTTAGAPACPPQVTLEPVAAAPDAAVPPAAPPAAAAAVTRRPEQDWLESAPPALPHDAAVLCVEHHGQIDFSHGEALAVPYIYRYSVARHGYPQAVPPLWARWTATLYPLAAGPTTFALRGTGRASLRVAGSTLVKGPDAVEAQFTVPLSGAPIPIEVEARSPSLRQLALLWQPPGGALSLVPESRLMHPAAASIRTRRLAWCLAILLSVGAILASVGGFGPYLSFVRSNLQLHLWLGLVLLGLVVRLHDYTFAPPPGETLDEFNPHLQGTCILNGDLPVGWDLHDAYPFIMKDVPFFAWELTLVAPMVHYPPAMCVLVGLVNRAAGAQSPFEMRMHVTRLIPITLGTISLALLWPAGAAVGLSPWACALGTAFFAVYPTAAIGHRLIKEDSLLAVLLLVLVWLVAGYDNASGARRRLAIGLALMLAILSKQLAVAHIAFVVLALVMRGSISAAIIEGLYAIGGILAFFWYGFTWGGPTFLAVQRTYTFYASHLDALWPLLAENPITSPRIGNGWNLGLWVLFALFVARHRKDPGKRLLALAVICEIMVLVATVPTQLNYGWYRLPLLPLLALTWGDQTELLFTRFDPLRALLWTGLFVLPVAQVMDLQNCQLCVRLMPLLTGDERATIVLRWILGVLVAPSMLIDLLPADWRRRCSAIWTTVLLVSIGLGFLATTWQWADLFPATWF